MNSEPGLCDAIDKLDHLGIPYMLAGSFSSNYYGQPRSTFDADVVVEIGERDVSRIVQAFEKEYYISESAARDAVSRKSMFNVIHLKTSFKVDMIVRKARPFSEMEFSRRRQVKLWGRAVWIASAEDVILSKLEWSRMGGSERQFNDAARVCQVQRAVLDIDYLRKWAPSLGVSELLERLLELT